MSEFMLVIQINILAAIWYVAAQVATDKNSRNVARFMFLFFVFIALLVTIVNLLDVLGEIR